MMTAQLETLRTKAMALSDAERAKLASDLVASLDGPVDGESAQAWDIEICRRINEIEADTAGLSSLNTLPDSISGFLYWV
jgi:putative addiction module component (TIGR02574 family)